jgi:oligopeptidase B
MSETMIRETPRRDAAPHDDLAWLRDRDDPRVQEFLENENRRTETAMGGTIALQGELYAEFKSRIREADRTAPVKIDDFYYYRRTEEGKPYRVWARAHGGPDAEEEILLDENTLARGHDFFGIGATGVSPDHRYLAYGYDVSGEEMYTLVVKDLSTGSILPERLEGTARTLAWAEDGHTLFYTTKDSAKRAYRVYRHTLGSDSSDDSLIYEESDAAFHVAVRKTRSRSFILIEVGSAVTSETLVIDARRPERSARLFRPRIRGVEYELVDVGGAFLVRTNDDAKNFRLLRVPTRAKGGWGEPNDWEEVIPHRPGVMLASVEAFRGFQVLLEREGGLPRFRVWPMGGEPYTVPVPEPVYTLEAGENPEFDAEAFRYVYSSPSTPRTVLDLDVRSGDTTVVKRDESPGFDPSRYESARVFAIAEDGVEIPISLVYARGLKWDGCNPCALSGYGAYGISYEMGFSSHVPSLLDRGFVYGIAHVRGGGEGGEPWHDQGKMLDKKTTFTDFIRCAETLIERGYTSSRRLGIQGRSAGGLLIGAVTNQRPDLFTSVIAGVPFVDVLSTMLDPSIPLTVIEYEEWGDPRDPEYYDYIRSYSPFDNVREAPYPNILATAGLNDPRVQYWEPARWVARLRTRRTDDRLTLLKTDLGAGHAGPSDRYALLKERAFEYAFLIRTLAAGLVPEPAPGSVTELDPDTTLRSEPSVDAVHPEVTG